MTETTLTCSRNRAEGVLIGHDRPQTEALAATTLAAGTRTILVLSGALDIATSGIVRSAVHELRRTGTPDILIDLRLLDFMDARGVRVLLELQEEPIDGGALRLIPGRPVVQRVFDLTGTSRAFVWSSPGSVG